MSTSIAYPIDYPESAKTKSDNVIHLSKTGDLNTLNNVIVCCDRNNNTTALFGDERWDISPYLNRKSFKNNFNFTEFSSSPLLQLELKLIVYGWLFHRAGKTNRPAAISTLTSRFSKLKTVYHFLVSIKAESVSALSNNKTWANFEDSLINKEYSKQSLTLIFNALNTVIFLQPWLKKDVGIEEISSGTLASKLNTIEQQQTLTIPERLADDIYSKAISLVEGAYPDAKKIAQIESTLQENYLAGKLVVDNKIKSGAWKWLKNKEMYGKTAHAYAIEVSSHAPHKKSEIISFHLQFIPHLQGIKDGRDFGRYYSQLITACYICLGAFSGMRDSELGQLTPESYYSEHFDNRDYHMLQSRTFKLGNKRETWVTAPISAKAIKLIATLTDLWRRELKEATPSYKNTLWVSKGYRSRIPTIIDGWTGRLKQFCRQLDIVINDSDYQECIESNPKSQESIKKYIKVGQPWHLTTHQFRRSLAFYTIKHRLGTAISLKQQFKHLYLSMTEWYTNGGKLASLKELKIDSELQALLNNTSNEITTNKIFNLVHSDQTLSGVHGKAILQMRDHIPHIYSSWDVIYTAVKNKTLTLHGTAHSYCKNGYGCDMDGVINPAFCVDCSSASSIIDEDNAKWWQKKHKSLTAYLTEEIDISPTEYSHYITQIRAAENVMVDFGMQFTTYKHSIEVVEL